MLVKSKKNIHYKSRQNFNKRKIIILILLFIIIISIIFLIIMKNKMAKIYKIGNNSSSQEIVDYILNINSYNAEIDVEVKSNKNSNKYKIRQVYTNKDNIIQEVIEPSNIQGIKIIKESNKLKIENSQLNLTKILENYNDITENNLDLNTFIQNYKENNNSKFKEENNQIILETIAKNQNNYQKYEKLYVSREDGKPLKMEIKDTNQNVIIYIIYNKIEI